MNNEKPFDPKDHQFEDVCMRNMLYQAEIVRLREENTTLNAEVATLKAERDEARRWVCRKTVYAERKLHDSVESIEARVLLEAQMRGWDCFKEVQP